MLSPESRAKIQKAILASAERLVKLLHLKAPEEIVAAEIALLLSKHTMLHGAIVMRRFGEMYSEYARAANRRCTECAEPLQPHDDGLCAECEARSQK